MANLSYVDTLRNNKLDEVTALVDAGTGAGLLGIYDGAQPDITVMGPDDPRHVLERDVPLQIGVRSVAGPGACL